MLTSSFIEPCFTDQNSSISAAMDAVKLFGYFKVYVSIIWLHLREK